MRIKALRVMGACFLSFTISCAPKTGSRDAAKEPGSSQDKTADSTEAISEAHGTIVGLIETFTLTLSLQVPGSEDKSKQTGLRSLLLHVPQMLLEPAATWPDGTPVSADASMTADEAKAVLDLLEKSGFFASAKKYHSSRVPEPKTPPPADSNKIESFVEDPSPHLKIEATVFDENWYTYRIGTSAWGDESKTLLTGISTLVGDDAKGKINDLIGQIK
jgi:hypothetical protein